jgi:hypothetical protein
MDPSAFDILARGIAHTGTRRSLVALLAALPLGGLLSSLAQDEAAAEHPIDRVQQRTPQRNRQQRNKNNRNNNNKNNQNKKGSGGGPGGGLGASPTQGCDVCPTCRYTTVQTAVADSNGPTTIRICPGSYKETIVIGRSLTLIGSGQGDSASDTILRGNGSSVITINPGVGPVTLQTLQITGGSGAPGDGGSRFAGGVGHFGTALTMTDCTIAGNLAGAESDAFGGGLFIRGTTTLTNCTVLENSANGHDGEGGGIYVDQTTLTLNNTKVTFNSAIGKGPGLGGGILNFRGTVTLQNGSSVTLNNPNNCQAVEGSVPGCSG